MAYDPKKAAEFNKLIQQGLSEESAAAQAGITDKDLGSYEINTLGDPATNPNYGQIQKAGFDIPNRQGSTLTAADVAENPEIVVTPVTPPANIVTTNIETVTGGGSRTTTVTPVQYISNDTSNALQFEADDLTAQKQDRAAVLRAEGKSGAEILRDPEYRSLSSQAQDKQLAAENAKDRVFNTGEPVTVVEPGSGENTFEQTGDPTIPNKTDTFAAVDPEVQIDTLPDAKTGPGVAVPEVVIDDPQNQPLLTPEQSIARAQGNDVSPVEDPAAAAADFNANTNASVQEAIGVKAPAPVDPAVDTAVAPGATSPFGGGAFNRAAAQNPEAVEEEQARIEAAVQRARIQRALAEQQRQANQGDWRVKLRLAPGADYLYKVPESEVGILEPLQITDGVIFPYTPTITTSYNANYNQYDLTHSNYRGYFYQNSYVGEIQLQATFTAQDTYEANYMLAVIHFFRSVTKMFYGKDAQRGAPPPLVFLQGLGQFQFNLHPCVVRSFNYNLPPDVDYIRARSPNQLNTNLTVKRDKQTLPTNPFSAAIERLKNAGVKKGAISSAPAPATLGTNSPTYVPTKMDMTIVLLPMQTRDQVSKQFSLKQFSNGDLLKGGFW